MTGEHSIYTSYRRTRYLPSPNLVITDLFDELIVINQRDKAMYCLDQQDRLIWKKLPAVGFEVTALYLAERFSLDLQTSKERIEMFIRDMLSAKCLQVA